MKQSIQTTGDLRQMLAQVALDVRDGKIPVERASAIHKLAKNIVESLYGETKVSMYCLQLDKEVKAIGDLSLGGSDA